MRLRKIDRRYKDLLKIALIYFLVLIIILVLVWPGVWSWDDIDVLDRAEEGKLTPWQHFLSGILHVVASHIIPLSGGVIIIQIILASLMVGYIVAFLGRALSEKYKISFKKIAICILIPFCFLPVIFYVMSGYRMAVYQYLEIFIFALILVKYLTAGKITARWLVGVGLLTILAGTWRTEGILLTLTVPGCLLLIKNKFLTVKRVAVFFIVVLVGVLGMNKINSTLIGNHNYTVGAIILPLVENIKANTVKDEESLSKIDKILELDCVSKNKDENAERIFANCLRHDYAEEDYADFMKESLMVVVKHAKTSLNAMKGVFDQTVLGMQDERGKMTAAITAGDSTKIYTEGALEKNLWDKIDLAGKGAIDIELRAKTIGLLLGTWDEKPVFYQPIFWNVIVPVGLTIIVLIYGLGRRKWIYVVMGGTVICWVAIVAMTAMAPYFMYYMPVYLSGYVLFIVVAVEFYEYKKIEWRALHEAKKT